jgi:hypothetical protein
MESDYAPILGTKPTEAYTILIKLYPFVFVSSRVLGSNLKGALKCKVRQCINTTHITQLQNTILNNNTGNGTRKFDMNTDDGSNQSS